MTTNVLVILKLTDLYNRDIILFSFLIGWCSIENLLEQPGATTCKERPSVNFLAHSKHFKQKSKCWCRNWLKRKWSGIRICNISIWLWYVFELLTFNSGCWGNNYGVCKIWSCCICWGACWCRAARKIETAKCLGHYFQISLIVQPVSRIISCLLCTQVSIKRMFFQLKLVLRENKVQMGNELTDAIVFMRINKSV